MFVSKELNSTNSIENKHLRTKMGGSLEHIERDKFSEIPIDIINNNINQTQNDFKMEVLVNDKLSTH
jgi:hypothetical protein